MDTARNSIAPALRTTFDDFGAKYALTYSGREFEPEFADGDNLVFSAEADHQNGDIVALWLRPEALRGRPQVTIWRAVTALGCTLPYIPNPESTAHPVLVIRSAVDGKARVIRAEDILGVHPKVGVLAPDGTVSYDAPPIPASAAG